MTLELVMPRPLVSVVVPAFNRSDCIANAVSSIQRQTYENWEAVVVDDGSTDGTSAVVERLSEQDSRVRLIRHEYKRGAQSARNSGITAARGEWVAFLDSDDTWLPSSLEKRLEVAVDAKVAVVHSGCDVLEQDGVMKRYYVPPIAGPAYRALLLSEGPMFQGLLVAKEALQKIGGLDDGIQAFQEWDTVLSLAKHYDFGFVAESTFIYDCRRTDTISKNYMRNGIGYEQVFHKRYVDILLWGGPGAMAEHYRRAGVWYERAADRRGVRRCALMSLFWSSVDARAALRKVRAALFRPA
jgi:glycosyltransferase involved in cell wall biosynthesis